MKVSRKISSLTTFPTWQTHTLKTLSGLILVTSTTVGLSNPSQAQLPSLSSPTPPPAAVATTPIPQTAYTLGAGDQLTINVFDVPEYSGNYQVLADGTINLPIIGTISLRGKTLDQATQQISNAYAPFIRRPLVTVSLVAPRPLQVAISGEVNRPGSYRLETANGTFPTLTNLIQLAGGMTSISNIDSVILSRNGQQYNVNLAALLENANLGQDPTLRDGDRIVIPTMTAINPQRSRLVATSGLAPEVVAPVKVIIVGEVKRPGSYVLQPEGQGEPITLTQALQQAQGVLPFADIKQVRVNRLTRYGERRDIMIDLWALVQQGDPTKDLVLQDGDSIEVPVASEADLAQARLVSGSSFGTQEVQPIDVAVVGQVYRPGTHTVTPGSVTDPVTLTDALQVAQGIRPKADIRDIQVRRLNKNGQTQVINVNLWQLLETGDMTQDIILQEGDEVFIAEAEQLDPAQLAALQTATFAPEEIIVSVVGEANRGGRLTLRTGTPLNEAIFAAGGINQTRGKKTAIDLMRLNPDGTVSSRRVRLDFTAPVNEESNPILQNGDVVVVPRNGFAGFADALGTILQPLQSVGNLFAPVDRVLNVIDTDNN